MCTETFQAILEPEILALEFNLMAKFGEHQALIKDLHNEILDLVITPINGKKNSLATFEAFTKEHIVLVAGKETDLSEIEDLIARDELVELEKALINNTWYSASNDMDHFRRFWFENFKRRADFKPNYILPNIGSILRSIENIDGFAIVPDFLAQESLQAGKIQLVWAGVKEVSNILYFATRKDLKYKEETEVIKNIFRRKMKDLR